jgi:hypothetical protein
MCARLLLTNLSTPALVCVLRSSIRKHTQLHTYSHLHVHKHNHFFITHTRCSPAVSLYSSLPDHWRVRVSFTLAVGRLGRWLNEHPALMSPMLEYVVKGLGIPKIGASAAEVPCAIVCMCLLACMCLLVRMCLLVCVCLLVCMCLLPLKMCICAH